MLCTKTTDPPSYLSYSARLIPERNQLLGRVPISRKCLGHDFQKSKVERFFDYITASGAAQIQSFCGGRTQVRGMFFSKSPPPTDSLPRTSLEQWVPGTKRPVRYELMLPGSAQFSRAPPGAARFVLQPWRYHWLWRHIAHKTLLLLTLVRYYFTTLYQVFTEFSFVGEVGKKYGE